MLELAPNTVKTRAPKETHLVEYFKHALVSTALVITVYLTINQIIWFISEQSFFKLNTEFSIKIVVLLILNLYFIALSIATWKEWVHSLITSLLISLTIFLAIFAYNTAYSMYASSVAFILLIYDNYKSFELKNLLIKYNPHVILKFSTRGLLFILSALAGELVFFEINNFSELNIGKKVAEFAAEPIQKIVDNQIEQQVLNFETSSVNTFSISPEIQAIMNSFGINELPEQAVPSNLINADSIKVDVSPIIENQVNNAIEPYQTLVNPLLAILLFGIFQFYGSIAYIVYSLSIGLIFKILTGIKFIR